MTDRTIHLAASVYPEQAPVEAVTIKKPRLLLISSVLPLPATAGQRVRVLNKLIAFREHFHITFLTVVHAGQVQETRRLLAPLVDDLVILDRLTHRTVFARAWHTVRGAIYTTRHSVRRTNYIFGQVELAPQRIARHIDPAAFDLVVFEYWHAHAATALFRQQGVPCALDLHDFLWRAYGRILRDFTPIWGKLLRRYRVAAYRSAEERAWRDFDLLIAINALEAEYLRDNVADRPIFYTPMGIDTNIWSYRWQPALPPRIAFYGSMGNIGNREAVQRCIERIMPRIWEQVPDVEFWIVGSNPPQAFRTLAAGDPRIQITGFVEDPTAVLGSMQAVLCPWDGRFGFRSRIVEIMAIGTPVIATPDAVYGMGLQADAGLLLGQTDEEIAELAIKLIRHPDLAREHSLAARDQVTGQFSFEQTYQRLSRQLLELALNRRTERRQASQRIATP